MKSTASTPAEYLAGLPAHRRSAVTAVYKTICKHIPKGFKETMTYGMLAWVVPHEIYPPGYHVDPKMPLGFVNLASQKNFIALYHMGLSGNPKLRKWFTEEYPRHCKTKLDMGKCCVRFKNPDQIPLELISQLMEKVTVEECIGYYEKALNR